MKNKKAQIWYTDFMVGVLIFVIVIVLYYEYANNLNQDPDKLTSDLIMDAKSITSSLITEGYPTNWNQSNVQMIGLTDGNQRLVQEKIDVLAGMDYGEMKTKLRTSYEYYLFLEDFNGTRILLGGEEGVGLNSTDSKNLVSLTRVVIYDSRLIRMVVQVWQ